MPGLPLTVNRTAPQQQLPEIFLSDVSMGVSFHVPLPLI
jgi:hypothetical protein